MTRSTFIRFALGAVMFLGFEAAASAAPVAAVPTVGGISATSV